MPRKIMLVDSSASMRRILRAKILANINDADVNEANDVNEAMKNLAQDDYHVVLFSRESSTDEWLNFIKAKKDNPTGNYPTSFILFTSSTQQEYIDKIKAYGVKDHQLIPCSGRALAATLDRVFNPYDLRSNKRYNLPDTMAILEQGQERMQAEVINISMGGLLCEMNFAPQYNLAAPVMITINFPAMEGEELSAGGAYSVMIRLNVVEANSDYSPKRVRVAYRFAMVPEETKKVFEKVFALVEAQEKQFGS